MKHLMTLVAVLAMASFSLGCESDDDSSGGLACQQYVECCADNAIAADTSGSLTFAAADAACQQGVDAAGGTEEACAALVTQMCNN